MPTPLDPIDELPAPPTISGLGSPIEIANAANADTRIGVRGDTTLTHYGNIYALAVFTSILTGDDLTRTKQWMAEKAGITL